MNRPASASFRAVLRANPDFRLLWIGNLVSSSGVWMQNLAQGWLLLRLSDSPFLLGLAGSASLMPTLALSLVGGTLADRVDRRRVLWVTHLALMLLALMLGALAATDLITPAQILIIVLLGGVAGAFTSPAYQASIPDLVRREHLPQAIALNSIQFNVARVGGHSLAGLLVARIGEAGCFFVNGVTYVAMLVALRRIRLPSRHIERDPTPFWSRFVEGLRYVRARPGAAVAIAMIATVSSLGLPYFFLLPAIGRDALGQGPSGVGYLMGSVSFGALFGAVLVKRLMDRAGREPLAAAGATLFWVTLIAFSQSREYWLSVALLIALGFALVLMVVSVNHLLQTTTPPELRGRVMGVYGMALNGLAPIGGVLAGALAQATSPTMAIASLSVTGFLINAAIVTKLLGGPQPAVEYS